MKLLCKLNQNPIHIWICVHVTLVRIVVCCTRFQTSKIVSLSLNEKVCISLPGCKLVKLVII